MILYIISVLTIINTRGGVKPNIYIKFVAKEIIVLTLKRNDYEKIKTTPYVICSGNVYYDCKC